MKKNYWSGLVLGIMLLGSGCGKNTCDGACDPIFPEVSFRIVNSAGQNLLCGPAKVLHSGQVRVTFNESGTLREAPQVFSGDSTAVSTGLTFVTQLAAEYYLEVNGVRTDTFQVAYRRMDASECCQAYNTITELRLNGAVTSYTFPGSTTPVDVIR